VHPGQADLALLLYLGEAQVASRNRLLGQFHLVGLPPAPVGAPQIEVSTGIINRCSRQPAATVAVEHGASCP
jgi:molecular chaperone DnaK (HSP70)